MTWFVPHREQNVLTLQTPTFNAARRGSLNPHHLPFAKRQRHCKKTPFPIFCNRIIKDISFRELKIMSELRVLSWTIR